MTSAPSRPNADAEVRRDSPGPAGEPLLLEVGGMRCGGCVRAVERRLRQQPGVREASVSLLTGTAWIEPQPGAPDPLPSLMESLQALGFPARPRDQQGAPPGEEARWGASRERRWWTQWRQLLVALTLLLASGLGHLADAGHLGGASLPSLLARPGFHALVATLAVAGPGRSLLVEGARSALAGRPAMDTLVGLGVASAYLSSLVGWLWPGSGWPCFFHEPVMLLGFVLAGRFLEQRVRCRTGDAIGQLAALQPDHALLLLDDAPPRPVRVAALRPGDRVRVLPGDRIPVDGLVGEGHSEVDVSSLTGEPLPLVVAPGAELAAGGLNLRAPLELEVLRPGAESTIARLLRVVERAQARKAPIESLADRVAGRFALGVLALALATLLFWWLWGGHLWSERLAALPGAMTPLGLGLHQAIAVLVVACPCALGLATPAAVAVGAGRAARAGLLFRGGDAIETAARIRTVLFDKTGTLTIGRPRVTAVLPLGADGEAGAADRLVQVAASLEQHSRHPLAHALLEEARARGLSLLDGRDFHCRVGEGLEGYLTDVQDPAGLARVGRPDWLQRLGVVIDATLLDCLPELEAQGATVLPVALGPRALGLVAVEDRPRQDAATTLATLRGQGFRLGLLSGDRRTGVERLGSALGLEPAELAWELLPEQKMEHIVGCAGSGPVAMVGDGINDAPALAAADLGVAVGNGTQIAQECADLVVMGERLGGVVEALAIARATMTKVRQNLIWAFGYNLVMLPIAAGVLLPAFGLSLSPPLAALLMATSSITVVGNALLLAEGR